MQCVDALDSPRPPNEVRVILRKAVWVDREIAPEIAWLNSQNVWTEGCCSGHGECFPSAAISPSSCEKARELGYDPVYKEEIGLFMIELKGVV